MNLSNKKVFITGGSAGIGKAIISELIDKGVTDFAVMGRTAEKMDALEDEFSSAQFLKIQGDVSQLTDVKKAHKQISDEWGSLDILINNAGVVTAGMLENISDEDIDGMVNVNVTGLILLTKHFLPLLKETEDGAIMNISSGFGLIAMPYYTVYAATKAAVKHFSEGIRRELANDPIHVMTVYPTATDTDMMETAEMGDMDSPETVAKASVKGLLHEEIEVILGGEEQKKMVETNLNHPLKVDKKLAGSLDDLQKRAENHRAM